MSKIYGDQETIKLAQNAKPGDKSVYINWDAINELPDEFEVIITKVKYNAQKLEESFSDIGNGNYMPNPELMYAIAEACGISGGDNSLSKPIIEEVDINPMLCKPIEESPTYRKMNVGRSVTKFSTILQEDGTVLRSSPCTIEFNVWERCCELWSKEELATKGYADIKTGKFKYFNKDKFGDYYKVGDYTYEAKYNNKYKRRAHFDSEMKFAHAKCETKAHLKTIRELAGLATGYKKDDLKSGYLIFSKVRRSRSILKAESAARLQALSGGVVEQGQTKLFSEPEPMQIEDITTEPEPTKREEFISTLNVYIDTDIIAKEYQEVANKVLSWLIENEDAEEKKFWTLSLEKFKMIEAKIPEQGRIKHSLY